MREPPPLWLTVLLLTGPLPAPAAGPDAGHQADAKVLAGAGVGDDGPALLRFFRSCTPTAEQRQQLAEQVGRLGHRSYAVRKKALAALVKAGPPALRPLREAERGPDAEVRRLAREAVRLIRKQENHSVPAAAARLLAARKPPGAAAVLLAYLPQAGDPGVGEEVRQALAAVAVREGKADPALVRALADSRPLVRGAAAEALVRAGASPERPAVRKLLRDPDADVRLRTALALTLARDKAGLPVLIDLLGELPPDQAWPAHGLLCQLAGAKAPGEPLGSDAAGRRRCRDAWRAWWRAHGDRVELARLEEPARLRGLTLVVLLDAGKVLEFGPDNEVRWQFDGLRFPLDAQVLPGERVLVAEVGAGRVTERSLKGRVLWQVDALNPVGAQRLPGGNTFIVTRGHLFEVDGRGKELYTFSQPGSTFVTARKFRDGRIAYVSEGKCVILDRGRKEAARFAVPGAITTSCLDALPNGRLLVAHYGGGRVVEYDSRGREVWKAEVAGPISAVRLPNGHTLVASQRSPQLVELDRAGKVVWQKEMTGHPTRARRR